MFVLWINSLFRLFSGFFCIVSLESLLMIVMFFLLGSFLVMRCSYIYGMLGYVAHLLVVVLPLFISLFFCRLGFSFRSFFGNFVPLGSPLWISPFVSLAELISYVVRPAVLLFRPFINLSVGAYGGLAVGGLCFSLGWGICIFLFFLFVYEVFVAVMHWFIVREILSFSVDH
uniref:ATP synthase F0 subunit 6 n=1 Tax=Trichobilharzia regenti TaxID=157069 RepID=A7J1L0_TRIRE|nr:ATP synthase F0 subunit 6 [Trichobilharzia regenti]ABG91499.1 ATP synthase F0 subunit 6 [Trichobilharzia regenti]BAV82970.1 ATP synthase F0 subunit 6 [Trichobilharzia regenti]